MRTAIVGVACAALLVAGAGPAAADDVVIGPCGEGSYTVIVTTPNGDRIIVCVQDPIGPIET